MYELDFIYQAATIINRTHAAASTIARYIYKGDDWFQDNVVPKVYLSIAIAASGWVLAILWTLDAGKKTGEWFREWFAEYVIAAIPRLTEEPQLALAGVAIVGLLPPAQPLRLPARWVGDEVILVGGDVVKKSRGRKSKKC